MENKEVKETENATTEVVTNETTVEPKEGFFTRCGRWMDKNTKKLACIAGGVVIGGLIYNHIKKKNDELDSEEYDAPSEDDFESSDEPVSNED